MKIAIVVDGMQVGGVEKVCISYSKIFIQLGYELTIFNVNPNYTEMEHMFPTECRIVHMPFLRNMSPEQYEQLVWRVKGGRFIYPIAFVILTFLKQVYKLFCKIKYKELREKYDIAFSFSSHINDLTVVTGNYVNAKTKLALLHGALYQFLLMSDGFNILFKKIKNLIVLSEDAQVECLMVNKYPDLNIRKIYNPIFEVGKEANLREVQALQEEIGPFIVMIARFDYPFKDHYTAALMLKILHEKYGRNEKLVFVGDGAEMQKVKEFVATLGSEIQQAVIFAGARFDVENYYSASSVFLLAGAATEGLPTVILEAMAYHKPVVSSDVKVGPREILGNDEYGLLCKLQDPEDMAEKINSLLTDKNKYDYYVAQGLKRVKDFAPDVIKKQIEEFIVQIASEG